MNGCSASRIRASRGSSRAAHDDSCLKRHAGGVRGGDRHDAELPSADGPPEAVGRGERANAIDAVMVGAGPQRPRGGMLPGACRPRGAGARAQSLHRRGGGEPAALRRLHVFQLLVRLQPAAHGDHPRARAAGPRAADHSLRGRLHADARRRAPGALRQPRCAAARDRPPLARDAEAYDGSLATCCASAVHQAAAAARAARPDLVQARATSGSCSISGGISTAWARSACTTRCASGP